MPSRVFRAFPAWLKGNDCHAGYIKAGFICNIRVQPLHLPDEIFIVSYSENNQTPVGKRDSYTRMLQMNPP